MKDLIGILGLGRRSTDYYIEMLQDKYYKIHGDYHTFPFLMYQIDFNTINPYLPNQFAKLIPVSEKLITELKKLPTQKWLIPNITFHETFDKLETKVSVFHPIQLCLTFCKVNKIKELVVFGTDYTMKSEYLKGNFERENIFVGKVDLEDLQFINLFRKKVYQNSESIKDVDSYLSLIKKYSNKYHVVIACTELSLIHKNNNSNKIIDLAHLQINEALNYTNK